MNLTNLIYVRDIGKKEKRKLLCEDFFTRTKVPLLSPHKRKRLLAKINSYFVVQYRKVILCKIF